MKKAASILIIITSILSLLFLIPQIIQNIEYGYYEDNPIFIFTQFFIYPLSNIAFILLGVALIKEGNSSITTHQSDTTANLPKSKTISNQNDSNPNDIPSTGLNIISFLIPLVGLIIYLIEKDKAPKKANSAGKAALWGIGVSVVFTILLFIISAVMISSMY